MGALKTLPKADFWLVTERDKIMDKSPPSSPPTIVPMEDLPSYAPRLADKICKLTSRTEGCETRISSSETKLEQCAVKIETAQTEISEQFAGIKMHAARQAVWIKVGTGVAAGVLAVFLGLASKVIATEQAVKSLPQIQKSLIQIQGKLWSMKND